MDTLRKLQAYCESRTVCKGCELAIELNDVWAQSSPVCAFDSAPDGWELDRFEEEIREIVGDAD